MLRGFRSRHTRKKSGFVLVEGVRACGEALKRKPGWLEFVVFSASFAGSGDGVSLERLLGDSECPRQIVTDSDFSEMAVTENPQGVLCVMRRPLAGEAASAVRDPFRLILDRIQEPGNLGTMLRTAWAVGLTTVWVTKGSADPYGPKAIRSGMGAQFSLEIQVIRDLAEARDKLAEEGSGDLWLAVPHGGVDCFDGSFDPTGGGLVIGNEAGGIVELSLGRKVSIPMPGNAESLNAAQAATVLLFETVRRRLLAAET